MGYHYKVCVRNIIIWNTWLFLPALLVTVVPVQGQKKMFPDVSTVNVGNGWAGNSINTVIFRKNSIVSYQGQQFISYYDGEGNVVLGKRYIGRNDWLLNKTKYRGNVQDAHNSISIALDEEGFVHIAWDHHNNQLHYAKSVQPFSLELTEMMPMLGELEKKVSYPEFYKSPNGSLFFFYRDGGSGNGNLVINRYDVQNKQWRRVQTNLIDGEGSRNAYWQACVDQQGFIQISWVWRESPDVASNHDMNYAISKDGGKTWLRSNGEVYSLPITILSAEKIAVIPQNSELINQTSMCTDDKGNPVIASYWKTTNSVPQYHILYRDKQVWKQKVAGFRSGHFSLSGSGTKKVPISRPQVLCWGSGKKTRAGIIFRDQERGNRISMAVNKIYKNNTWKLTDLNERNMGEWEPTYDTELWRSKKQLHLFAQKVEQADKEAVTKNPPQMVQVLQVPVFFIN
jgi:hypothetical protein